MTKSLSYALIGDENAVAGVKSKKDCLLTGLWSWHACVEQHGKKGCVKLLRRREDLEVFDIIHINLTGGNWALPEMIRQELGNSSSTKIMCNIDFTIANWDNFPYPTMLKTIFKQVDIPFHVEPIGTAALSHLLDRKVWTLPHPCNIKCLDQYKRENREPYIVAFYHRYHQMLNILWLAQRDTPLHHVLIGYDKKGKVPTLALFDKTELYKPFMDAIDIISRAKFALDLFPFPVYGRSVVDAAAVAVPTVCSSQIEACRRCFPDLCIKPWDIKKANELFNELIKDDEKYEECFKNAYYKVEYYGYKACYNRLVEAVETVETLKQKGGIK